MSIGIFQSVSIYTRTQKFGSIGFLLLHSKLTWIRCFCRFLPRSREKNLYMLWNCDDWKIQKSNIRNLLFNVVLRASWRNLAETKRQQQDEMMTKWSCLYQQRKNQTRTNRKIPITLFYNFRLEQSPKHKDVKRYFQVDQRKIYFLINRRSFSMVDVVSLTSETEVVGLRLQTSLTCTCSTGSRDIKIKHHDVLHLVPANIKFIL